MPKRVECAVILVRWACDKCDAFFDSCELCAHHEAVMHKDDEPMPIIDPDHQPQSSPLSDEVSTSQDGLTIATTRGDEEESHNNAQRTALKLDPQPLQGILQRLNSNNGSSNGSPSTNANGVTQQRQTSEFKMLNSSSTWEKRSKPYTRPEQMLELMQKISEHREVLFNKDRSSGTVRAKKQCWDDLWQFCEENGYSFCDDQHDSSFLPRVFWAHARLRALRKRHAILNGQNKKLNPAESLVLDIVDTTEQQNAL